MGKQSRPQLAPFKIGPEEAEQNDIPLFDHAIGTRTSRVAARALARVGYGDYCVPIIVPPRPEHPDQSQRPSVAGHSPCRKKVVAASSIHGLFRSIGSAADHTQACIVASPPSSRIDEEEEYQLPEQHQSSSLATPQGSPQGSRQRSSQVGLGCPCSLLLVVIDNPDLKCACVVPAEDKAPLLVNPDTPETGQIT